MGGSEWVGEGGMEERREGWVTGVGERGSKLVME